MTDDQRLADDAPLSLLEACEGPMRGLAKPSTLRTAIIEGKLEAMRIGKRYIVTPAGLRKWMESCRVVAKAPPRPPAPSDPSIAYTAAMMTLDRIREQDKRDREAARKKRASK